MMKNKFLSALLGLILTASAPAMAQSTPQLSTYQTIPFWMDGQTVPHVMLVLERDWKMFYPAYNNLADLDGDGALDIGFNPKVTYVGYFDSDSCYTYTRTGSSTVQAETGLFVRAGATTPQTQDDADDLAEAKGIDGTNLSYPASAHGVCGGGGNRGQGLGQWHGNWLNYALTSRMDAIRKVLYGGKRTTDTAAQTILEMVRVPANSNVWGGELYADDVWELYAPSSPWYDIELFTGFNAPTASTMHFWARGDYYWTKPNYSTSIPPTPSNTSAQQTSVVKNSKPLFRVVTNIPMSNRHPFLKVPLRIWDWTGDHASYNSIPSDGHLMNSRNPAGAINNTFRASDDNVGWHFAARVEVCKKGNISPTEGCRAYQSNFKPIGLLQEYGESSRMFFGLLTGTISHPPNYATNDGTRYKGGVVRHHIDEFNTIVKADGTIVRPGVIDTIDVFEITGVGSARSYSDGSQAGNPLGEMVWEAVRYLGGLNEGLAPTSDYGATGTETKVTPVDDTSVPQTLPKLTAWTGRPVLSGSASECPKPIILAISEVFPDHDSDNYPNLDDFKNVPRSSFAAESDSPILAGQFDIAEYLKIITDEEDLKTTLDNNKTFFYPSNEGLCTAKNLTGLADVLGHCPSEPSLAGTYNLAAVTYYAHTHDFGSLGGPNGEPTNIDFYAVGIPGNFPDITLTVDSDRSMTLMPIALTSLMSSTGSQLEGNSDPAFRTLLNFFIEYWQTDDGHQYMENGVSKTRKIPYKVKFRTNFEFTMSPCFVVNGNSNNWERDLFNSLTISLLTDSNTLAEYREKEPLFINSGPFKTVDRATYLTQRAAYRNALTLSSNPDSVDADSFFTETPTRRYYYAFKRPQGGNLDISGMNVVGAAVHSDSTGSGYGASGLTGYTITGVTFPGAYLDVGLNRSDYPIYYSGTNCSPSMSAYVPNTACGDEAVPLDPAGSGLPGAQWNYAANGTHNTPSGFNSHRSGSTVYTNNADCGYYHPPTMRHELLTPAECPYFGYQTTDFWTDPDLIAAYNPRPQAENVCGRWAAGYSGTITSKLEPVLTATASEGDLFRTSLMRYVQVRSFKFDTSADRPVTLPNPMWLAAKYGGFSDQNKSGTPDLKSEWMRNSGSASEAKAGDTDPYNYFGVANMSELPDQLGKAFEAIASSASSGTANAASVSMVLGGGVSLQTQYRIDYASKETAENETDEKEWKITWGGAVYALFTDKWGNLRVDSNQNKKLDLATSPPLPENAGGKEWKYFKPGTPEPGPSDKYETGDLIVHLVPSATEGSTSLSKVFLCRDVYGDNNGGMFLPSVRGAYPGGSVTYPPYADCQEQPGGLDSLKDVLWNAARNISNMNVDERDLFTFYEAGSVTDATTGAAHTVLAPVPSGGRDIAFYPFKSGEVSDDEHLLHVLMGQDTVEETKSLIEYIRGTDDPSKYRNRTARLPWDAVGATPKVWRMGDVINSRPVIVGEPNSNFHITYSDSSYEAYRAQRATRRQVAYFGSNDGILHAVNLGFFGAYSTGRAGYDADAKYELGDEIWGFLPPSVLPHLQWLANEAYQHSYYMDLKPYIVDVKDSAGGPTEADQWRTILIVGLRLGGAPIQLVNGSQAMPYSTPEFFALDVTDPEASPKLLWRFSDPSLGQSTAMPVIVRSGVGDKWYIVLPSGPVQTDAAGSPDFEEAKQLYAGRSTDQARVIILDVMTGEYARLRDQNPNLAVGPDPLIVPEERSFFNDTFLPRALKGNINKANKTWFHHTVYLSLAAMNSNDYDTGAVYRLQMVDESTGQPLVVDDWKLKRFYKTDKPVTAAVNSSYDQFGNLWVLFGTGRIWGPEDMTPCVRHLRVASCLECYDQYMFGIKEPLGANGLMTFAEVAKDDKIVDVSGVIVYTDGTLEPKVGGCVKSANPSNIGCETFEDLYSYMRLKESGYQPVVNGYKLKLETWRKDRRNYDKANNVYVKPEKLADVFELINTQVKLDELKNKRLNAVVTTYAPSGNVCKPLGMSYLTVFDAFTGLPAPYMGSYSGDILIGITKENDDTVEQVTAAIQAGVGMNSEAVVVKGEDGTTIYRSFDFLGQNWDMRPPATLASGSGFISWREVVDMFFDLKENTNLMYNDL